MGQYFLGRTGGELLGNYGTGSLRKRFERQLRACRPLIWGGFGLGRMI